MIEHNNGENASYVSRVAKRGFLDYEVDVRVNDWEDEICIARGYITYKM